jgi:hypothetical protein
MADHDLSYELVKYENRWVALLEAEQRVVGWGADACEALQVAERNGYSDVLLMRVREARTHYALVGDALQAPSC